MPTSSNPMGWRTANLAGPLDSHAQAVPATAIKASRIALCHAFWGSSQ